MKVDRVRLLKAGTLATLLATVAIAAGLLWGRWSPLHMELLQLVFGAVLFSCALWATAWLVERWHTRPQDNEAPHQ